MMCQKVAICLHQSFLCARKQRQEDTVKFSQVFVGQEWKESALLFNEKFGDFCKKKFGDYFSYGSDAEILVMFSCLITLLFL